MSSLPVPNGVITKVAPGNYIVERELTIAGRLLRNAIACHNPAFGTAVLDTWEAGVRAERLEAAEDAARKAG